MPHRITRYEDVCRVIGIPYDTEAKFMFKLLEQEGHTEKSICFAVWKENRKLRYSVKSEHFWTIFLKLIRKWSWPEDDPRWEPYRKKQEEREKAKQKQMEIKEHKLKRTPATGRITGFVYFIQGESGGPVKIGYTVDIHQRLLTLQKGHIDILKVLLLVPGNFAYEHKLHSLFEPYRLNGEWYKPVPEIFQKIEEIKNYDAVINEQELICKQ